MSYSTPLALFADRTDADLPLSELCDACCDFLVARENPVSASTVRNYRETFKSFEKSLTMHNKPLVISSVTVASMRAWAADMRAGTLPSARKGRVAERCSTGTIAPRFSLLKAFTHTFIYKELKLTSRDLLEDLPRLADPKSNKEMLTNAEIAAIRDSFTLPTFEHVRDRAIFEVHMATAFRYDTVLKLPLTSLERVSGRVTVMTKGTDGGTVMQGKIDSKALAHVRNYLRMRPTTDCPAMFVKDDGTELSYQGARNIWRRIKKRSGVKRIGSHLVRHTFAQRMALGDAERGIPPAAIGEIADVLGHTSDKMARRYAGAARTYAAADIMARYSLSA